MIRNPRRLQHKVRQPTGRSARAVLASLVCTTLAGCARLDEGEPTSTWKIVIGVVAVVYLLWKVRGWLGGGRGGGDGGGFDGIDGFGGDGGGD
ncbi:MAG: hypothetical protein KDH20_02990 [Rhodocyclaceae bacterium]|nr:hypothetical protein [Rhodocyclaceae bacterium]